VRTYFESNHISWSMWEYQYGFGIFESDRELFESDVTTSVIEALGLTVPPQKEFIFAPDTSGFIIYDDFLAQRVVHSSWFSGGEYDLNFLSRHNPVEGDYCISWTGADLYSFIGMYFPSLHDLTQLIQYGYMLNLWASCTTNNAKLNLRFIDTKTENPNDHPWTMCYILDNTKVNWDGTWQHVQIPLSAFTEQGAYDDGNWYTPQGEFDWSQVERFQIGTDYHDLDGVRLFLDDIRIVEPAADVQKPYSGAAVQFVLEQNYPNPFNPVTTIHYSLPQVSHVKLEIFNMLGQKVSTLIDANQEAGSHNVEWSITDDNKDKISSGIYFYSIEVVCVNHVYQAMRKMIIIK
ncbi:T9SS type A sorting domain-containing protein, partial [candidate division KSB1 bacterium]|nr:T9SS type A sorting domain-containing protein [candidate division KSB1 bacterium]